MLKKSTTPAKAWVGIIRIVLFFVPMHLNKLHLIIGTKEEDLIRIIGNRSLSQRHQIRLAYFTKYGNVSRY